MNHVSRTCTLLFTAAAVTISGASVIRAQDKRPPAWPLPSGETVSGLYSCTKDFVYVLDVKTAQQWKMDRKTLPEDLSAIAENFCRDLAQMIEPINSHGRKKDVDYTVGTYKGNVPFEPKESEMYVISLGDGISRYQFQRSGRVCMVNHLNDDEKGTKNGLQLKLYPSGSVCSMMYFMDGKPVGYSIKLWPDGSFLEIQAPRLGPNTRWNFYPNGGRLSAIHELVDYKRHGSSKHFMPNDGELWATQTWENDVSITKSPIFNPRDQDEGNEWIRPLIQSGKVTNFAELWK